MKSGLFSLSASDFFKGALLAVLVPVLQVIIATLQAGTLTFDWVAIGTLALSTFLAYVLKNFFSPTISNAVKTVEKAGGTVLDK